MYRGNVRPSPNEESQLLKKERERRRLQRLVQVREQSKCFAKHVREEYKKLCTKEKEQHENQFMEKFAAERKAEMSMLKNKLRCYVGDMGQGHQNAESTSEELAMQKRRNAEQKEKERIKVDERFKSAMKELNKTSQEDRDKKEHHIRAREKALDMERARAKEIATLPPPKQEIDMHLEHVKGQRVIVRDAESFACTHYSLPMQTIIKRPNHSDLHGPSGTDFAEEAIEKSLQAREEVDKLRQEQDEKALLRHKHALAQIRLEKAHKEGLQELEQLERQYRSSRQQKVTEMPQNLFQPSQNQIDVRNEKQREMERAFERPFVRRSGPQYVVDISDRSSLSTRTIVEDETSEEESMSGPPHSETLATPSGQTSLETSVTSPATPTSPSHSVQTVEGPPDTLSIGDMDSHFTETPSLTTTDSTVDRNSQGSPAEVPPLSMGEVESTFQNVTEAVDQSEGESQHDSTLLSESQVNSSAPSKLREDNNSSEEQSDSTCSTPSTGATSLTSSVNSSCTDTQSEQSVSDNDNSDSPPYMNGTDGTSDSPPQMNGTDGTSDSPPHMNGTDGTSDSPPHMNGTAGTSDSPPHMNGTAGNNTHSPQTKDTGGHGDSPPHVDDVSDPDVVKQLQFPFQVDPSKAYQQPSLSTHPSTVGNQLDDAANKMSSLLAEICSRQEAWMEMETGTFVDPPQDTGTTGPHPVAQEQMRPLVVATTVGEDEDSPPPSTPLSVSTLLSSLSFGSDVDTTLTPSPSNCSTRSWSSLQEVQDQASQSGTPSGVVNRTGTQHQANITGMPSLRSHMLPASTQISLVSASPNWNHPPLSEHQTGSALHPSTNTSSGLYLRPDHARGVLPGSLLHHTANTPLVSNIYLTSISQNATIIRPTVSPSTSTTPLYPSTSTVPLYPSTSTAPSYPSTSTVPPYPSTSTVPSYPSTSTVPLHPSNISGNNSNLQWSPHSSLLSAAHSYPTQLPPSVIPLSHSDKPTAPPPSNHQPTSFPWTQDTIFPVQSPLSVGHTTTGLSHAKINVSDAGNEATNTSGSTLDDVQSPLVASSMEQWDTTANSFSPGVVQFAPEEQDSSTTSHPTPPTPPTHSLHTTFQPPHSIPSASHNLIPSPSAQTLINTSTSKSDINPPQSQEHTAVSQHGYPYAVLMSDSLSLTSSTDASSTPISDLHIGNISDAVYPEQNQLQSLSDQSTLSTLSSFTPQSMIQSLLSGQYHGSVQTHSDLVPNHMARTDDLLASTLSSDTGLQESTLTEEETHCTPHQTSMKEESSMPLSVDSGSGTLLDEGLNKMSSRRDGIEVKSPIKIQEGGSGTEVDSHHLSFQRGSDICEGEPKRAMSLQEAFLSRKKAFIQHSEDRKREARLKAALAGGVLPRTKQSTIIQSRISHQTSAPATSVSGSGRKISRKGVEPVASPHSARSKRSVTFSSPVTMLQDTGLFSPPDIHNHKGQVQSCGGVVPKESTRVKTQRKKMSKQEMITVNKKLYNQLAEVRRKREEEERHKTYQANREKAKDYQKKLQEKLKLKKKQKSVPTSGGQVTNKPIHQKPFK